MINIMLGTSIFVYPVVAPKIGFLNCVLIFIFLSLNYCILFYLHNKTLAELEDDSLTYPELVRQILGKGWNWVNYPSFFYFCILTTALDHIFRKYLSKKERDIFYGLLYWGFEYNVDPAAQTWGNYGITLGITLAQAAFLFLVDPSNTHRTFFNKN